MDVATISLHDAGIRKAAILVASLDQAAADLLLGQLGHERAELVRQAVAYLDDIAPQERQRIVDEFRRIGPLVPSQSTSGIELDRLPPGQTVRPLGQTFLSAGSSAARQTGMPVPPPAGDDPPPFDFLRDAEDEKLSRLLGDERSSTVALVLSNLPPERAGEVLARLAPAAQIEVVRRLVDLDNTDPETLGEIEKALETRWLQQFAVDRRRAAGPETVARNPRRVRSGSPRTDPRQPRRARRIVGRAIRPAADRFRGDRPVRRCRAAGRLSHGQAGSPASGVPGSAAVVVGPAVRPFVAAQKPSNCVTSWPIPIPFGSATWKRPGGRSPRWRSRSREIVPEKPRKQHRGGRRRLSE